VMEGKIDDEWHVCYSQFTPDGGPFIELTIWKPKLELHAFR
jgi:hypothetical protein